MKTVPDAFVCTIWNNLLTVILYCTRSMGISHDNANKMVFLFHLLCLLLTPSFVLFTIYFGPVLLVAALHRLSGFDPAANNPCAEPSDEREKALRTSTH